MKRREFITLLGSTVAAWPLAARAQQSERVRRVGVLLPAAADDAEFQTFYGAFLQALAQFGWTIGHNVQIDLRWGAGDRITTRKYAVELAALAPDVIVAHGGSTVSALQQATQTIPIVFTVVSDPVATGYAISLARPGGNITGFMSAEYSSAAKLLELLKQIAPGVTRAAILRDSSAVPVGVGQFSAIQTAAVLLGVEVSPVNDGDLSEMERAIALLGRSPNAGVIVTGSGWALQHRDQVVSVMAGHKLPAIYFNRTFVKAGGLASFGVDFVDQYRRTAGYVDRILRGEKPGDLPVQMPVKYQTVINMRGATALGLDVPPTLLARADEVIE